MKINDLSPAKGARKHKKRIGRGPGSGHGKTATRGHKGQKSRAGGKVRPGFEGGQMPLHRRLPKRGFTNIFKKSVAIVNLKDLDRFSSGDTVGLSDFIDSGLVKKRKSLIKLLGTGDITFPLNIKVHKASETAKEKIERAGGKVELV